MVEGVAMAEGPGKYDSVCTMVREATNANGVMVIVFGGHDGDGVSAQMPMGVPLAVLAQVLRSIADGIEKDDKKRAH